MTRKLLGLAKGKLVVALEGGYNEEMTATCAEAVIRVMLGEVPRDLNGPQRLKACTEDAIRKALAAPARARARRADRGFETVTREYGREAILNAYVELYERQRD